MNLHNQIQINNNNFATLQNDTRENRKEERPENCWRPILVRKYNSREENSGLLMLRVG
jgi:hypothetical protein